MKTAEEWKNDSLDYDKMDVPLCEDLSLRLVEQIQQDAIKWVQDTQLKPLQEMLVKHLGKERLARIDKDADEKVGEGVVPSEDIFEFALREYRLDAMKEGMRRAALYADDTTKGKVRTTILSAAEQLTEKDL